MAALLTLTETELLGLSETDLLAMTLDGSSSGGSSPASCLWTEARIAAIENRLSAMEAFLGTLATSSALSSAQNAIVSACKTASGFATPANITAAQNAILAQCKTAVGFATPEDVKLTATTQTVEVQTQEVQVISQTINTADLAKASELAHIRALLDHWSVSGNTLTTYDTAGNTLSVHSLTRDGDGNIVAISH